MSEGQITARSLPHVLVATNALSGGGAQRSNLAIASGLARRGFPTSVLTVRPADENVAAELLSSIRLHDVGEPNWPRWTRAPQVLLHILRVKRSEQVDVIIAGSFGLNQVLLAARALGILRCPLIVVEHLGVKFRLDVLAGSHPFATTFFREVLSRLYRHAGTVVAVSHGVANEFRDVLGLPTASVETIYNGIEVEAIRSMVNDAPINAFTPVFDSLPRPIVISVGRLEPQKAQEDFLAAFALLPTELRGSLVILGEGSRRELLTGLARELGIQTDVHLPGHVENPWWFIARSDVFALSSHFEGFALVLVEALACGVPVVSTDCPSGPSEILERVERTRLVPVRAPAALCSALSSLLRDEPEPSGAVAPTSTGRNAADRFRPEAHGQAFARLVARIDNRATD